MARRFDEERLLVASHNEGKVAEIRALLAPFATTVRSAGDLDLAEPVEDGASFLANARLKAVAAARASGWVSLADDSGLVVPALGGEPGVRSARWGGPDKDFGLAMREVHDALERLGDPDRIAEMVTALALAWPDGHVEAFEGRVPGALVWPPRGELGFGYEPMFAPGSEPRTYGEMARDEKHVDDPRARAFAKLVAACFART